MEDMPGTAHGHPEKPEASVCDEPDEKKRYIAIWVVGILFGVLAFLEKVSAEWTGTACPPAFKAVMSWVLLAEEIAALVLSGINFHCKSPTVSTEGAVSMATVLCAVSLGFACWDTYK